MDNKKVGGRVYIRVWRPPDNAEKIEEFWLSAHCAILSSRYRPRCFVSGDAIADIGYFLIFIAADASDPEPELCQKMREIASECSFAEVTDPEEVKTLFRDAVNRGVSRFVV